MADSIVQTDKTHCYLCGMNSTIEPLDEHHIFSGHANRKLSERYGLKVYIHHSKCHLEGVHKNAEMNKALKAVAQQIAMNYYGWSVDDFRNIFGKNYLIGD